MERKNFIKTNILLAEFIGEEKTNSFTLLPNGKENWEYKLEFGDVLVNYRKVKQENSLGCDARVLRFHESWNWLMHVIDKIELMEDQQYAIQLSKDTAVLFDTSIESGGGKDIMFASMFKGEKIFAAYDICVQFINWFNKRS